jgi:predicted NodU family carbamoyl transferase
MYGLHPRQLINHFHRLTGCPVLINTSFDPHSEPIVSTTAT